MTTTLNDIKKVIDDYIVESGRNMASIETLENLMALKFSTYRPAIKWKIQLMHQSGIIEETPNIGVFKLIGSGRLKFLDKTDKQPEPTAKKAVPVAKDEDIDRLLGDITDDDSNEEIEDDD